MTSIYRTACCLILALAISHFSQCESQAQELREQLQTLVAANPKLDGTRIDNIDDNGNISGILGSEGQIDTLEGVVKKFAARHKRSLSIQAFKDPVQRTVIPIDTFHAALQRELSANPNLKGTRIDRVYFDREGHLSLTGVAWLPKESTPGESLKKQIELAAMEFVVRDNERWNELQVGGKVVVSGIKVFPQNAGPLAAIRQIVEKDNDLDGVHIGQAQYTPTGSLHFTGIASKDRQKQQLLGALQLERAATDTWKQWVGAKHTPLVTFTHLIPIDHKKLALQEAIKRAILSTRPLSKPSSNDGLIDKVLINRIYYNRENQLAIEGIRWNELSRLNEKNKAVLKQRLTGLLQKQQAEDPELRGDGVNIEHLTLFNSSDPQFKSPLAYLWDFIPRFKEFDGIRVDRAYYKDGILHFTGIQAQPEQTNILKDNINQSQPLWETLAPNGIHFDPFPIVPAQVFKERIQNRLASDTDRMGGINGAELDRVYYTPSPNRDYLQANFAIEQWKDSSGPVRTPHSLKVHPPIQKHIEAELDSNKADWSQISEWGTPAYPIVAERDNLLPILRDQISEQTELDGIRLDKAFYGNDGQLYFSGLFGREGQLLLLKSLIHNTFDQKPRWKEHLDRGWSIETDQFTLWPIDALRVYLQRLMPGYPELDGASLTRLYHHKSGQLAVDGRIAAATQKKSMANILGKELAEVPQGRERLRKNKRQVLENGEDLAPVDVAYFEEFPITHDFSQANALLSTAWHYYWSAQYQQAIDQLDMALLYDPACVNAWYLRALCYIGLKEIDLARRDIRRAVMALNGSKFRLRARHQYLANVQGTNRLIFEQLVHEALLGRPNGIVITMSRTIL